jgi:hypothetical protein
MAISRHCVFPYRFGSFFLAAVVGWAESEDLRAARLLRSYFYLWNGRLQLSAIHTAEGTFSPAHRLQPAGQITISFTSETGPALLPTSPIRMKRHDPPLADRLISRRPPDRYSSSASTAPVGATSPSSISKGPTAGPGCRRNGDGLDAGRDEDGRQQSLVNPKLMKHLTSARSAPDRSDALSQDQHDRVAIESLFVTLFLEAHKTPLAEITIDRRAEGAGAPHRHRGACPQAPAGAVALP